MIKSRILSVGNYSGISEWPLNAVAYVLIVKWSESCSVVSDSLRPQGLCFATPWTIQSMEFSGPEYWSGWPFPSPGDLPKPGIEPRSPALQANSSPAEPQRKPLCPYKGEANGNLILMEEEKAVWPQRQRMDTKDCWQTSEARRCKEVGRRFLPQTVQRYSSWANTGFQPADTNFVLLASRSVIE